MINLPIGADDVAQIVAIEDPILRNLWITQSYANFATRLQAALGGSDHTWCGFAVWASATAGQSIRKQELPGILGDILASPRHQDRIDDINVKLRQPRDLQIVLRLNHVHLLQAIRDALDNVSDHIAHGNTLVFAELSPLFVAFIEQLEDAPATLSEADVDHALARAATEPIDDGLRQAFGWYWRAHIAGNEAGRANAILAGNVLAVAHEQKRLQADIAAALDAGLLTVGRVAEELLPRWAPHLAAEALGHIAGKAIDHLLTELWDEITTELLMTLRVPGATLRLRDDVPPGPGGRRFPVALTHLSDTPPDSVFLSWDRTGGSGLECGARDWAVLRERMNYIVNLFRSRQQDESLAVAPFSDDQLASMRENRVPTGPLLPKR